MSGHQLPIDESEEMKRPKCKTEAALPTADPTGILEDRGFYVQISCSQGNLSTVAASDNSFFFGKGKI